MYLVSACLVGVNCRYNGKSTLSEHLVKLFEAGKVIPVCPEVLGQLPIPRQPAEIIREQDGSIRVISKSGKDVTKEFLDGAIKTLEICRNAGIEVAILQSRSPSCGYGKTYDGSFSGNLIEGNGLAADLLAQNGIKIYNEDNWMEGQ